MLEATAKGQMRDRKDVDSSYKIVVHYSLQDAGPLAIAS